MTWKRCRGLIASDLWRHAGRLGAGTFCSRFLSTPGFRYTALLRFYAYTRTAGWCQLGVRQMTVLLLHRYSIRFGLDISRDARIGSGLYIGHFGGIVVNAAVVIGDNCNLSQGVTLGQVNRGPKAGCPTIGDNDWTHSCRRSCGGRSERGRGARRPAERLGGRRPGARHLRNWFGGVR